MKIRIKVKTATSAIKKMVVAGVFLASSQYVMASCPVNNNIFNNNVASYFPAAKSAIFSELKGMNASVSAASKDEVDNITAAVFVLANQKALGTTQVNTALKSNTQVQAAAMQSINQSKRYQKVIKDYGAQGLGYDICRVSENREDIQEATIATQAAIGDMVKGEITARAGKYGDKEAAMATRLALHNKYYCTEGQAQAGLCQAAGERSGKSLSASTLFVEADYLSAEYNDKSALINNMVGLPDNPVATNQASTAVGQSYADLKRRKDALKSTAMTSLKSIQADWSAVPSPDSHEHQDGVEEKAQASTTDAVLTEKQALDKEAPVTVGVVTPLAAVSTSGLASAVAVGSTAVESTTTEKRTQSLMAQVKADVARYLGGGAEYEEWSKTLTGQEEKGLLTEVLKVKALRLYLQTQEFKQLQRMEAMLAANVVATTENSGMNGRIEAQRQVAVRNTIRDKAILK